MSWIIKLTFVAGVILSTLGGGSASAQSCTTSASCSTVDTCQSGLFGRYCGEQRCNADSECPAGRRICSLGSCRASCTTNAACGTGFVCATVSGRRGCFQADVSNPGGQNPGGGISQSGVGGVCGPQHFGPVIVKNIGCQSGLTCRNGHCER